MLRARPQVRPSRTRLLGALLFAATIGVAAAMAYQAVRSAASHRIAAEASLRHHAGIAAWRFAREARSWLEYGMVNAGSGLQAALVRREALPGPEVLQQVLAESQCDCMTAGFGRSFFRITGQAVIVVGDSLSSRTTAGLLDAAGGMFADSINRPGRGSWRILPPGEPQLLHHDDAVLLWSIPDPLAGADARVLYGMVVQVAQLQRPLREAFAATEFFPPSLVPSHRADALVRIAIAGPSDSTIFVTGPASATFSGKDTVGDRHGALVVTAGLDPAAAELLLDAALPASPAPLLGGLLAVATTVGLGTLLLLRREQRLVALREDFVSSVSHELRTPLTQIRMLSELFETDGFRTEAERMRAHRIIHRESLRLSGLVDNILEFGRRRRVAVTGHPSRLSVAVVVGELAESFAPLLAAKQHVLSVQVEDDVELMADRDALNRVLRNLLENAVKYGPDGQTIGVTISRGAVQGVAWIAVDDQGSGVPVAERERIFEPYFRLERDRHSAGGGSGIGLAVVAELVQSLGGRVWVSDAPSGGARFVVELPTAPAAAALT